MQRPKLFLLHFAGGGAHSFPFSKELHDTFIPVSLELPGRGKRFGEPLLTDFESAAKDIVRQILGAAPTNEYCLFGHSMGSSLALRVSHLLEPVIGFPRCLIVSGNPGPGAVPPRNRYRMPEAQFMEELKAFGGMPREVIDHPEIMQLFLPILRADFEISERNSLSTEQPIPSPIFAMMGDSEEYVGHIDNWRRFTSGPFWSEVLEGDHFFINRHPKRIASLIREVYGKTLSGRWA